MLMLKFNLINMRAKSLFFLFLFLSFKVVAQENLLSLLNEKNETEYASYIFKGTKIVNGQSVEITSKNELKFNIQHRFGPINSGFYNLYGLDYAQVRFSFDYGVNNWMAIGVGRSSVSKTLDGNIKIKLIRQSKGNKNFPLTVVVNSASYLNQYTFEDRKKSSFLFTNQLIYSHQILIARKVNRDFSVQVSPTFIHYNLIDNSSRQSNDNISIGIGCRYKLSNRVSVNAETFPQIYNSMNDNILSFGFDIETGGHVFQLHLSNSPAMIEPIFITETISNFFNGNIYFGFNISRVFTIKN